MIGTGKTFFPNGLVAVPVTDTIKYIKYVPALGMVQFDTRKLLCKIVSIHQVVKVTVIYRCKQLGEFLRLFGILHARCAQ